MSSSGSVEKQDITGARKLHAIMSEPTLAAPDGEVTTKSLGIDELTILILEKVPKQHLSKLRGVSKKWGYIISSIGYAVKPVSVDPEVIKKFPMAANEDLRYDLDVAYRKCQGSDTAAVEEAGVHHISAHYDNHTRTESPNLSSPGS